MGLKTPLYDTHVSSRAKIIDFGGWDMPLSYGSQLEEHHAVRRDAGVFDVIDAGGLKVYRLKSCVFQLCSIVGLFQSSGDAAHPKQHAFANGIRYLAAHYNIRDGEAAARAEYAEGFFEDASFICGEVDNAVGDDDVD